MMNPKRSSHIAPKTNARHNGKLKEILQSVTYKQKCEPKVEEPDVFNVPVIRQNENCNLLPKYTSVLAKSGEDGISMVDLDMLQQDLEKLLSTSAVRIRYLLAEIGEIDKNCESPEKKTQVKVSKEYCIQNLYVIFTLFLFFWHHNPGWVFGCLAMTFHSNLSCALVLHCLMFMVFRSRSMSSNHFFLALPFFWLLLLISSLLFLQLLVSGHIPDMAVFDFSQLFLYHNLYSVD
uniref:Uncharacterized protein LOC114346304 n=1 Tax=Diabrotica virgifera virgifera TaxID=50390 RepID=A0A6P7HAH3_DIAVI